MAHSWLTGEMSQNQSWKIRRKKKKMHGEKHDMDIFSALAKIRKLWSEWELRALVLASLFVQTLLMSTAGIKNRASKIGFLIWLCYFLADWVATFALGVLTKSLVNNSDGGFQDQSGSSGREKDGLKELWVTFLLLHLGGPDNITAFSLEDNELWLRHLLGLLIQVGTTFFIFLSSLPEARLLLITILVFTGGTIKYVQRILALMNASRDNFRSSMVTDPDPGPDYAEIMEEYCRQRNAGNRPIIREQVPESEELPESVVAALQDIEEGDEDSKNMREMELISTAHIFFQILIKRLIVDLILTFHDGLVSWTLFTEISWEEAYKVIEIELGFLYEILYTKAAVVHTLKGWILRLTSVSSIIAASIIFCSFIEKQRYDRIDVTITYIFLSGAIALEFWSLTQLVFTEWTIVWMKKKNLNRLTRFVFKGLSYRRPPNRSRLSNSMAQYNLIQFCLKDQPFFWGKVMKLIHVKDLYDKHWYRTYKNISMELKKFIFEYLKSKVENLTEHMPDLESLRTGRGQLALEMINTDEVLDNSIKAEFDKSILLWHIATDICYYLDGEEQNPDETVLSYQRISRDISNYMLYLLVSHPLMLPAGIGQIRFGDTCAEAKRFFHRRRETTTNEEQQVCKNLHEVNTDEVPPVQVKGDKSNSVLFEAVMVAKSLLKQETDLKKRWEVISLVWLEMLYYAASECKGYYHAQKLASGGELLTLVCFLMVHFGIADQFRVYGELQVRVVI